MSVIIVNAVLDMKELKTKKMQFNCPGCDKNCEYKFDKELWR